MTTIDRADHIAMTSAPAEAPSRPQLLVVDDQPINIRALHQIFADDHEVFVATSGEQAVTFCLATPPDLVLLDVVMPEMNGLEVCRTLKANPDTATIPVIFVTSQDDPEEEGACWDAGGVDFITKPINAQTTRNRVRAHLTLKHQADVLRRLAWIDGLTGVANKRQYDERVQHEWRRCRRDHLPLSMAVVDIDYFKAYNDTYGHLAGDDCLRSVASAINSCMARSSDFVARTGGEEFICVLPDADLQGARVIAERIDRAVRELRIPHSAGALDHVTVSVGVASVSSWGADTPQELFQRADRALYRAKHAGRARIEADEATLPDAT